MSEAEIQAELMKRHSGPSMGFVKLQLGVLRTPDMVAEIAMKWTKVLRTGAIGARFMGVDWSTIMFTMERGLDTAEVVKSARIVGCVLSERLSLYPKGINKNVMNGHISLYLEITETGELPLGWEVNASFKLFVFDQIRDEYLTVQEFKLRIRDQTKGKHKENRGEVWFSSPEKGWGYPEFLLLKELHFFDFECFALSFSTWTLNETWVSSFFYKPCNYELFVKQSLNMEMTIVMARDAGMDWIIHLDTDELLHPVDAQEHSLRQLLLDVPGNVDMVIFPNYGASLL